MSIQFQSMLGLSNVDAQTINTDNLNVDSIVVNKFVAQTILVNDLIIPNGSTGDILTRDADGIAVWEESDSTLHGDATGPISSNTVTTLAGGTIPVSNLVQINGIVNNVNPESGKVLTCIDSTGSSSWQSVSEVNLQGDCTGPASQTRVDTLAGGTIPVNNLVQINGIVNNQNAESGKILTCTDSTGSSSWQNLPAINMFNGVWDPTTTYSIGNRVRFNATNPPPYQPESLYTTFTNNLVDYGQPAWFFIAGTMKFTTVGVITGIRFYHPPEYVIPDGGYPVGLWVATQSDALAQFTILAPNVVDGWNDILLDEPITTIADTRYAVSYIVYRFTNWTLTTPPSTAHIIPYITAYWPFTNYPPTFNPITGGSTITSFYGLDIIFEPGINPEVEPVASLYVSLQNNNLGNRPSETLGIYWNQELTGFDDNGLEFINVVSKVQTATSTATPNTLALRDNSADIAFHDVIVEQVKYTDGSNMISMNPSKSSIAIANGAQGIASNSNTSIGTNCLPNLSSGSSNTSIGNNAGVMSNGDNCTFLGANSGVVPFYVGVPATYTNCTAIGAGAVCFGSNTVQIGNSDVVSVQTQGDLYSRGNVYGAKSNSLILSYYWNSWDASHNFAGPFINPLNAKIKIIKSPDGIVNMQFAHCIGPTNPDANALAYATYSINPLFPPNAWAVPVDPDGNPTSVCQIIPVIYGSNRGFGMITITTNGNIHWQMLGGIGWPTPCGYEAFSMSWQS